MTSSFPPQTLRLKDYLEIFSTYFKISQEWKILEHFLKNFRQVSLLLLSECERINQLQLSPKSTKDHRFFVFLMISERIKFTSSLNIRSKIGQYSLQIYQQMSILSTEKYQMIKQVFLQTMFRTEAVAQRCSVKKVLLKISQNSQENTCARASFNKVAGLRSANLFKKRFWHRCFPVHFAKFPRTPFLRERLRWLLLLGPIRNPSICHKL